MKKISLKNLNLSEVEELSREQLKNVLGGYSFGTTSQVESTNHDCNCASGRHCAIDVTNNPSAEEIQRMCNDCCNG